MGGLQISSPPVFYFCSDFNKHTIRGELMETIKLLRGKFSKKNKKQSHLERGKVRMTIDSLCRKYLVDEDCVLTFEVSEAVLNDVLVVIEDSDLVSKYEFCQESKTLFMVKLRELDLI